MTMTTEFDRLLGAVLAADGPQSLPVGLVDAALREARTVRQRRALIPPLDALGWPPLVGPQPRRSARRLATLAVVALLIVAGVAAVVLIGGPRPPRVLGDGQRAYVWAGRTAALFTADEATGYPISPGRSVTGCPTLVAGSTVIARFGYSGWDLVDVVSGAPVSSVDFNTAGFERWSSDARRMAILDAVGRVGIATFDDIAAPVTTWYETPGIQWLDWSLDGERLAIVTQLGTDLAVEVLDVATGDRQVVHRQQVDRTASFSNGLPRYLDWSSNGSTMVLQVVDERESFISLLDTAGESVRLDVVSPDDAGPGPFILVDIALTADGSALALVTSPTEILITDADGVVLGAVSTTQTPRGLAWAADGRTLAFIDGSQLITVGRDGLELARAEVSPGAAFLFDGEESGLVVATVQDRRVVVERYETDTLTSIARQETAASASSLSLPSPGPDGELSPICLQLDVEPALLGES